jgi:hypothetical protein
MTTLPTIGLLGAEKQSAVSAARAWPERRFLFLSDQRVIDGWDLANVTIRYGNPAAPLPSFSDRVDWIPLCPRWQTSELTLPGNRLGTFRLQRVLAHLHNAFPEHVLPVRAAAGDDDVIVKGDTRHRPDGLLIGTQFAPGEPEDPYHCGVLVQPFVRSARTYLATGRRLPGGLEIAVVAIHAESCAREDVLQAGEVVEHQVIAHLSIAMLQELNHRGFFTLNWIEADSTLKLTSIRPVPRALFGTLRCAGLDLFGPPCPGVRHARAGGRFTVDIHYSSYQALSA